MRLQPGTTVFPWRAGLGGIQRPGTTRIRSCCLSPASATPDLCRRPVGERLRREVPGNRGHSRLRRSGRHAGRDREAGSAHCNPRPRAGVYRCTRALATARKRLEGFVRSPGKHALYAAKVLLKYKLLELQHTTVPALQQWADGTPYSVAAPGPLCRPAQAQWLHSLVADLERSGAAVRQGERCTTPERLPRLLRASAKTRAGRRAD